MNPLLRKLCVIVMMLCCWVATNQLAIGIDWCDPTICGWIYDCPSQTCPVTDCNNCCTGVQASCIAGAVAYYEYCKSACDPEDPEYQQCVQDCGIQRLEILTGCTIEYLACRYCCRIT